MKKIEKIILAAIGGAQTLHWFSPVDGEPLTVHLIYENDGDKGYPIRSYADYLKATENKTE